MRRGTWVQSQTLIERSADLAPAYRNLAERLGISFEDAESWNVEASYDGVHFSPDGHAAFARGVQKWLRSISDDTDGQS